VKSENLLRAFFPDGFQLPNVKTLHVPDIILENGDVSNNMVSLLSGFTGLNKLVCTSIQSMASLKPIFKMLPFLTDLRLEFGEPARNLISNSSETSEDSVLTGVASDKCRTLLEQQDLKNINLEDIKLEDGLADLKSKLCN